MERRSSARVVVHAPCGLRLLKSEFVGVVENISRQGLLLRLQAARRNGLPHVGAFVTVHVQLPASQSFGRRSLECHAMVVRLVEVLENPRHMVLGLSVSQMKFTTAAKSRLRDGEWEAIAWLLTEGSRI
jgi:hypothetical protein